MVGARTSHVYARIKMFPLTYKTELHTNNDKQHKHFTWHVSQGLDYFTNNMPTHNQYIAVLVKGLKYTGEFVYSSVVGVLATGCFLHR